MPTQVILLERVESLGAMGEIVSVKPGYARNYLLPQSKALRATKENIAYYETQKAHLQKVNNEKKGVAEAASKNIEGLKVVIIRQASEGGQLYGSVTARDIADSVSADSKQTVTRGMVIVNQNFKSIGLFPVDVMLHPEVKVKITVNIARSTDEAAIQAKTGKAVIAANAKASASNDSDAEAAKAAMLEEGALANEKAEEQEEAERSAEASEKAAKKATKKSSKKSDDASEDEAA